MSLQDVPDQLPARESHPMSSLVRPTLVVLCLIVLLTSVGLWYSYNGAASAGSVQNSQDITACRAVLNTKVQGANANLAQAKGALDEAKELQERATHYGLIAVLTSDKLTQFYVVMDGPISDARIASAQTVLDRAQTEANAQLAIYNRAVVQSFRDPDRFLSDCRV